MGEIEIRGAIAKIADDAESSYWELRNWLDNHPRLEWTHGDDGPAYPFMQLMRQARAALSALESLKATKPVFKPLSADVLDRETVAMAHAALESLEQPTGPQAQIDYENGRIRGPEGATASDNPYPNGKPGHSDWERGRLGQPTPPAECGCRAALKRIEPLLKHREDDREVCYDWCPLCVARTALASPCSPCSACAEKDAQIEALRVHLAAIQERGIPWREAAQQYLRERQEATRERDSLQQRVKDLEEGLRDARDANVVLAYDTTREDRLRGEYARTFERIDALLTPPAKESL